VTSDYLPDSPTVARPYCPACEPDADPCVEILDVRWCTAHAPAWSGLDDDAVTAEAYLSGSAEAGGADNRRWCEFFHREPEPAKPARARRRRSPAPAPSSAGC
jgi:hypothetical protein